MAKPDVIFEQKLIEKQISGPVLSKWRGIIQMIDEQNQNGRVYTEKFWRGWLNDEAVKEKIERKLLMGQITHPEDRTDGSFDVNRVSHTVSKIWIEGKKVLGEIEIFNTDAGRNLNTLLEAGVVLGVSSRSLAVSTFREGIEYIDEGDILGWDYVPDPSVKIAIPEAIGESITLSKKAGVMMESIRGMKSNAAQVINEALNIKGAEMASEEKKVVDYAKMSNKKLMENLQAISVEEELEPIMAELDRRGVSYEGVLEAKKAKDLVKDAPKAEAPEGADKTLPAVSDDVPDESDDERDAEPVEKIMESFSKLKEGLVSAVAETKSKDMEVLIEKLAATQAYLEGLNNENKAKMEGLQDSVKKLQAENRRRFVELRREKESNAKRQELLKGVCEELKKRVVLSEADKAKMADRSTMVISEMRTRLGDAETRQKRNIDRSVGIIKEMRDLVKSQKAEIEVKSQKLNECIEIIKEMKTIVKKEQDEKRKSVTKMYGENVLYRLGKEQDADFRQIVEKCSSIEEIRKVEERFEQLSQVSRECNSFGKIDMKQVADELVGEFTIEEKDPMTLRMERIAKNVG